MRHLAELAPSHCLVCSIQGLLNLMQSGRHLRGICTVEYPWLIYHNVTCSNANFVQACQEEAPYS